LSSTRVKIVSGLFQFIFFLHSSILTDGLELRLGIQETGLRDDLLGESGGVGGGVKVMFHLTLLSGRKVRFPSDNKVGVSTMIERI